MALTRWLVGGLIGACFSWLVKRLGLAEVGANILFLIIYLKSGDLSFSGGRPPGGASNLSPLLMVTCH
jgi:hypothetical protein